MSYLPPDHLTQTSLFPWAPLLTSSVTPEMLGEAEKDREARPSGLGGEVRGRHGVWLKEIL